MRHEIEIWDSKRIVTLQYWYKITFYTNLFFSIKSVIYVIFRSERWWTVKHCLFKYMKCVLCARRSSEIFYEKTNTFVSAVNSLTPWDLGTLCPGNKPPCNCMLIGHYVTGPSDVFLCFVLLNGFVPPVLLRTLYSHLVLDIEVSGSFSTWGLFCNQTC